MLVLLSLMFLAGAWAQTCATVAWNTDTNCRAVQTKTPVNYCSAGQIYIMYNGMAYNDASMSTLVTSAGYETYFYAAVNCGGTANFHMTFPGGCGACHALPATLTLRLSGYAILTAVILQQGEGNFHSDNLTRISSVNVSSSLPGVALLVV